MRPDTPPRGPIRDRLAVIPAVLLMLLLVGLGVVVDPAAYDVSQLPRLLVLSAMLLVAVPLALAVPAVTKQLDTSVLREPLLLAATAYLASCVGSLAVAVNVADSDAARDGYTYAIRGRVALWDSACDAVGLRDADANAVDLADTIRFPHGFCDADGVAHQLADRDRDGLADA